MRNSSRLYELEVLVKDKSITEYPHKKDTFIEGRKGSEYTLRVKNHSAVRVCAVISVDGLNVIGGEEASNNSAGYILNPFSQIDIPGWKVDDTTAAKFVFKPNEKSYAAQSGHGTDNNGVIGVKIFQEKFKLTPYYPTYVPTYVPPYRPPHEWWNDGDYYKGITRGSFGSAGGSVSPTCSINSAGGPIGGAGVDNFLMYNSADASAGDEAVCASAGDESIGTGFGQATDFNTYTVQFDRNPFAVATLLLFYDTRKNLERRGIDMNPKPKKTQKAKPEAFPGDACKPPKGWSKNKR